MALRGSSSPTASVFTQTFTFNGVLVILAMWRLSFPEQVGLRFLKASASWKSLSWASASVCSPSAASQTDYGSFPSSVDTPSPVFSCELLPFLSVYFKQAVITLSLDFWDFFFFYISLDALKMYNSIKYYTSLSLRCQGPAERFCRRRWQIKTHVPAGPVLTHPISIVQWHASVLFLHLWNISKPSGLLFPCWVFDIVLCFPQTPPLLNKAVATSISHFSTFNLIINHTALLCSLSLSLSTSWP